MKLTLNLASRRYFNRRAINQAYLLLCLMFCGLLVYLAIGFFQGRRQIKQYQVNISDQQTQLEKLQKELPRHLTAARIEKQKQDFMLAEEFLERDAFRWTELFDRLERLLPTGVSLRSFNPDYENRSLQLNGVARGLPELQALLDNLLADSFQQVYLQRHGRVEISAGAGDRITALNFSLKIEGVY
jgi:type IV pilus assembly protein PilN